LLLLARSARRELSMRRRHRLAIGLALAIVVFECLGRNRFGDATGTLRNVAWCAALSVSGTFGAGDPTSDHEQLFRLRGRSSELRRQALPLARAALAFTVHGGASLVLGLSWLPLSSDAHEAGRIALSVALLCLSSLAGALALGLLASVSEALLEKAAGVIFIALLIAPAALHAALPELPSPIHAWAQLVALCLQALPA
jgi:hypothetical protein